jgi:PKD repeat protein
MGRILVLFAVLSGAAPALHAATEWVNAPGGVSIAVDTADNVYTVNWEYNPGGDITLTKRDASGVVLWEQRYDNTDMTRHEVATWVATDSAGNAIVSGTVRSGYSSPVNAASLVMKFAPDGRLLWRRVYESNFDGSSTRKVLVDGSDHVYVLGLGNGPAGIVTSVKKFAPDGTTLWTYYDTAGIGAPVNFKFTPDQHIVIAGRAIYGSVNGYAKITLDGAVVWSLAGVYSLTIGDVAGDRLGHSYVVHGEYVMNGGTVVRKLSPTGAGIWALAKPSSGFRVEVGSDDRPVVSGFPNSGTGGAAFFKLDVDGTTLWTNFDADGPSYALLMHAQMRMDGADAVYLAAGTLFEMAVCKVNEDGTSAWVQTAPGGYASGFDFGRDGSVYVVGGNTARFSQDGTPPPPPVAPSGLTATLSAGAIMLNWQDNAADESAYAVERSEYTGTAWTPFAAFATLPANTSTYADRSFAARSYSYRVRASNAAGFSAYSNIATITVVSANDPPTAVMTATPSSGTAPLTVTFDGSGSFDSFGSISAWTWAFGDGTFGSGVTTTHLYTTPGTYTATLTVTDNGNLSNSTSASIVVNAAALPNAPASLTATALSRSSIRLNWVNRTPTQTEVRIERCTGSNCTNFVQIAAVAGTATTYRDNGRASRTTYTYRVRAHNATGDSPYSNTASARTTR